MKSSNCHKSDISRISNSEKTHSQSINISISKEIPEIEIDANSPLSNGQDNEEALSSYKQNIIDNDFEFCHNDFMGNDDDDDYNIGDDNPQIINNEMDDIVISNTVK